MNRLNMTFDKLKQRNEKAFSVFLMSGYPDDKTFIELMHACVDAGADIIEVGMPFSDPSADGPAIKIAGGYALKNGVTTEKTVEMIKEFRKTDNTTPIVWMGYFNPIYKFGTEKFIKEIENAGADGLLAVDLPIEEFHRIKSVKESNIDFIRLITPVTTEERIGRILKDASGFIYYVSIAGITGTKDAQGEMIKDKVTKLKTLTNLPILVGFGIKTPENAKNISNFSDGVIVGSAVISKITNHLKNNGNLENKKEMINEIKNFISECAEKSG